MEEMRKGNAYPPESICALCAVAGRAESGRLCLSVSALVRTLLTWPLQPGSSNRSKDRTFRVVFRFSAGRPRTATRKPLRTYRNPVCLAREWQQALDRGDVVSRADLARRIGVSRARVTQVLGLLALSPKALRRITTLGDPLEYPIIAERQLRPIVHCRPRDQERRVKAIPGKRDLRRSR
jgi:hypothetical protein